MEDIRIGRSASGDVYTTAAGATTVTTIAPADPKRICLVISCQGTNAAFVGPKNSTTGSGKGILLNSTSPNIVLRVEEIGSAIWQEWVVFTGIGGANVTVISTSLEKT